MRILSFIEDQEVIKTILKHLGLWLVTRKPAARANAPPRAFHTEYSDAQIPPPAESLYLDPEYSLDVRASWFQTGEQGEGSRLPRFGATDTIPGEDYNQ